MRHGKGGQTRGGGNLRPGKTYGKFYHDAARPGRALAPLGTAPTQNTIANLEN